MTEVAKAAGVSIATVSRVINRPEVVSAATRERVLAAMEHLQFSVNPAASALRRGHGNMITVLAASLSQPWYTKLMRALELEIDARGFTMMQVDLQHDPAVLQRMLQTNGRQLSTGLVLATGDLLTDRATFDAIRSVHETHPLVVIGQHIEDATWPTVRFTDEEWAYRATKEMLESSETVAFLGRLGGSYLASERLAGYRRAMQEVGVSDEGLVWRIGDRGYQTGLVEVLARIEAGELPEAIFAINDELALGASRALLTAGYRIPEDVAVMGFGNTEFLDYVTPTLSSVDGSAADAARVAIEALWAQLDGEAYDPLTVLERRIVHRESTRHPESSRTTPYPHAKERT
ncbi:LacI family DNA-binding transcriptional regulator [Leucobacter sp. wl10]|uniref:LacI family DNA-binding transcriptional regulator n=1 Tax=Leucobacter sp. wl10 TaxID=2304677 RepID=UPI0013C30A46|nr:LacI family DNA-binding transcriptional regulator [Leucobacter sp. wl10]